MRSHNLEKFFNPGSVAVIGASANPKKVGYSLVKNLLDGKALKIYPVSLNEKEILGLKAFPSVLSVPEPISLAIIAVKAEIVPQILSECAKKQVRNVIVISSGFKEVGPPGKELEDKIARIAKENKISLLGPNCLGYIDARNGLNASFAAQKSLPGKIALLSQSGALGTAMLDWAINEGVGFSKFVSLGNEAGLTEIDFLEYLAGDPDTEAILMYLEKINNGSALVPLLKSITAKKPVVVLKAGASSYGASAIRSHTGSLAPEQKAFEAACRQAGAIIVPSLRKFFNMSKILSLGVGMGPRLRSLAVLTNGGGPSVIAADEIGISQSLSLAELSEDTKNKLKEVLPPMAAVGNPVDIIGDALAERYEKALDVLCSVPDIDGVIVMLTPQMMTESERTAKLLANYKEKKKIFPVFMGGQSVSAGRAALIELGLVHFAFSKDVVTSLDDLANAERSMSGEPPQNRETGRGPGPILSLLPFPETVKILSGYGISLSGRFVANKEDLGQDLSPIGSGPYAMKAISRDMVHKTEAGAVRLNISGAEEAVSFWDEVRQKNPEARIEGALVQNMEKGKEVIIGMKRDAAFGPVIMFGLGGIFAESLKDIVLRVAPVDKKEALKMMKEIKGIKILEGVRGEPPVDFGLLADIIVGLSRLALEHSEIREIDLNPVMATPHSATVVDARIMI